MSSIRLAAYDYRDALREKISTYHNHGRELSNFQKDLRQLRDLEECVDHVTPPSEGCMQTIFHQLPDIEATQALAFELLERREAPKHLPAPWHWHTLKTAYRYRPGGLYVVDYRLQAVEMGTAEQVRSHLVETNGIVGGRGPCFGASDVLVALALIDQQEMYGTLAGLDASQILLPGLSIQCRTDSTVGLFPLIGWNVDGRRKEFDVIWSNQPLSVGVVVPIVTNTQLLQEIIARKDKASDSR